MWRRARTRPSVGRKAQNSFNSTAALSNPNEYSSVCYRIYRTYRVEVRLGYHLPLLRVSATQVPALSLLPIGKEVGYLSTGTRFLPLGILARLHLYKRLPSCFKLLPTFPSFPYLTPNKQPFQSWTLPFCHLTLMSQTFFCMSLNANLNLQ